MAEENEYRDDITIDKFALDDEWMRQPSLYMKWSERYATAVFERDQLKERLDVVKATLDAEVRVAPEDFGFNDKKKPTETAIANIVLTDSRYTKANMELADANRNVNILSGVRVAMEQKKKGIEMLAYLWMNNYYSEPDVPVEIKDKSSESTKGVLGRKLAENKRLRQRES